MGKQAKPWLVIGGALVAAGMVIFIAAMTALRWDFARLNTETYETNTHEVGDAFRNITIETDTADILFAPAEDGKARVVCYEPADRKHSVTVKDGTLTVRAAKGRWWYIGVRLGTPTVTVYLPERAYASLCVEASTGDIEIPEDFAFGDVGIASSTGDIRLNGVSARAMELSVTTGRITLSDIACEGDVKTDTTTGRVEMTGVRCENLTSNGSTGALSLKDVVAAGSLSLERSTGDVTLDGCDAAELFIETDTGDVTGTLLSEKVFLAETTVGRVDLPRTTTGGPCEIRTDTGTIRLEIE